jgi:hypothetical protein
MHSLLAQFPPPDCTRCPTQHRFPCSSPHSACRSPAPMPPMTNHLHRPSRFRRIQPGRRQGPRPARDQRPVGPPARRRPPQPHPEHADPAAHRPGRQHRAAHRDRWPHRGPCQRSGAARTRPWPATPTPRSASSGTWPTSRAKASARPRWASCCMPTCRAAAANCAATACAPRCAWRPSGTWPAAIRFGVMPGLGSRERRRRQALRLRHPGRHPGQGIQRARARLRRTGRAADRARRHGGTQASFDTGLTYLVNKDCQVDVSLVHGLNRRSPDLSLAFGLSLRM